MVIVRSVRFQTVGVPGEGKLKKYEKKMKIINIINYLVHRPDYIHYMSCMYMTCNVGMYSFQDFTNFTN